MNWFFYALFVLANAYVVWAKIEKSSTLQSARVVRAEIVASPQLKGAYNVVAECADGERRITVVGALRSIRADELDAIQRKASALIGATIEVFHQPLAQYATDHELFRGPPLNLFFYLFVALCAVVAFLYQEWGIHPVFDLIHLFTN